MCSEVSLALSNIEAIGQICVCLGFVEQCCAPVASFDLFLSHRSQS